MKWFMRHWYDAGGVLSTPTPLGARRGRAVHGPVDPAAELRRDPDPPVQGVPIPERGTVDPQRGLPTQGRPSRPVPAEPAQRHVLQRARLTHLLGTRPPPRPGLLLTGPHAVRLRAVRRPRDRHRPRAQCLL